MLLLEHKHSEWNIKLKTCVGNVIDSLLSGLTDLVIANLVAFIGRTNSLNRSNMSFCSNIKRGYIYLFIMNRLTYMLSWKNWTVQTLLLAMCMMCIQNYIWEDKRQEITVILRLSNRNSKVKATSSLSFLSTMTWKRMRWVEILCIHHTFYIHAFLTSAPVGD